MLVQLCSHETFYCDILTVVHASTVYKQGWQASGAEKRKRHASHCTLSLSLMINLDLPLLPFTFHSIPVCFSTDD